MSTLKYSYFCMTMTVWISLRNVTAFHSKQYHCCNPAVQPLEMSLTRIPEMQLSKLVSTRVTPDQWRAYWVVNKTDRLQRILESVLLAYGGAWLSWFLSFMAGSAISSIVGTLLIFNWMYTPWLAAKKNNERIKIQKGGKRLVHALYQGRISKSTAADMYQICVLFINNIYWRCRLDRAHRRTPGTVSAVVSQNYLTLKVEDEEERSMEVVTPWQDSYSKLRVGMTYETVIASTQADFTVLIGITDGYAPACNVWVGDYPYLNERRFSRYVATASAVRRSVNGYNDAENVAVGAKSVHVDVNKDVQSMDLTNSADCRLDESDGSNY